MRFAHFATIALLLAPIASQAQTAATPDTTIQAPAAPQASPKPKPKTTKTQRFQARFESANTSHDGHLTLDQAKANKWRVVVKNFSKVDSDGKGYVTSEQLRSYYASQQAAKVKAKQNAVPSTEPSAAPGSTPSRS